MCFNDICVMSSGIASLCVSPSDNHMLSFTLMKRLHVSKQLLVKNFVQFNIGFTLIHRVFSTKNIILLPLFITYYLLALFQVTELAPLRSLLECLKEPALRPSFPVISLCDFALQICDGMQYLENKKLIHRDLAARNILVFAKNRVSIN